VGYNNNNHKNNNKEKFELRFKIQTQNSDAKFRPQNFKLVIVVTERIIRLVRLVADAFPSARQGTILKNTLSITSIATMQYLNGDKLRLSQLHCTW